MISESRLLKKNQFIPLALEGHFQDVGEHHAAILVPDADLCVVGLDVDFII